MKLSNSNHTAVLLFTRTAAEEAIQKGLVLNQSVQDKELLAAKMIAYTQAQVKQAGLPLYTAYSTQQEGSSFGERLANEVEKVFAKGHEHVIIIGNDCLQLTTTLLRQAATKSKRGETVLGPTTDGGLYLIGLHKKQFDKARFIKLDWETEWCYDSFLSYIGDTESVHILRTFTDLDSIEQLKQITAQLQDLSLIHI